MFWCEQPSAQWITAALHAKKLQKIIVRPSAIVFVRGIGETVDWEWEDLDHLLVQFQTRHLIRPGVTYVGDVGTSLRDYYARRLLPELTRRRLIDVVQYNPRSGPRWYGRHYVAIVIIVSSSRPRLPLTIAC